MRLSLALVTAFVFGGPAFAQDPSEDLCPDCHTTGRIEVEIKPQETEFEQNCRKCSEQMRAHPESLGLPWIPCPKCRTPSVQARAQREFDGEFGKRKAWLDAREAEVDSITKTEPVHIETEHFVLTWDVPKLQVGRVYYDKHKAAHMYADRLELLYRQMHALMGITDTDTNRSQHRVVVLELLKHWQKLAPAMTNQGGGGGNGTSLIGVGPYVADPTGAKGSCHIMWVDKKEIPDDFALYQTLTHRVSHHLVNDVREHKWWLFQRYGWVYEGLSFYMEIRNFGPPRVRCGREAGMFEHWKGKNWEKNVKAAVMANEYPSFQEILQKSVEDLNARDVQFAWSWVDYLMWYDPTRMDELLGLMKGARQLATRDALKEAYDLTVPQFVEGWVEFVKTEYSLKPKDGATARIPRGRDKNPDDGLRPTIKPQ